MSWGQVWMRDSWRRFYNWYEQTKHNKLACINNIYCFKEWGKILAQISYSLLHRLKINTSYIHILHIALIVQIKVHMLLQIYLYSNLH